MRINRNVVVAGGLLAAGLVAFAADAGATVTRTLPGFAGVLKSQSFANWNNAYEAMQHTSSGTDGIAYNLPVDTSQGFAAAVLNGTSTPSASFCGQLLAVDNQLTSVWQSASQCSSYTTGTPQAPGGNFGVNSLSFEVFVPVDGWAALEVSATGNGSRINDVQYGP